MPRVLWERRLIGRKTKIYKASVDRTDCPIFEPTPFDPKWVSHKFKGPGVRYEVGIAIGTGEIVWAFGPFPCGAYNDLNILDYA